MWSFFGQRWKCSALEKHILFADHSELGFKEREKKCHNAVQKHLLRVVEKCTLPGVLSVTVSGIAEAMNSLVY